MRSKMAMLVAACLAIIAFALPIISAVNTPQAATSLVSANSSVAHGPMASFSPPDGTTFNVGDSVVLNASSSLPGYDTGNISEICPITSFAWRVEYFNGTVFGSFYGQTASFKATVEGDFRIILAVTAPDPHLPSDPGFTPVDSASALIIVGSSQQVDNIDVFTDKGGVGSGLGGGVYGPLELVKMYAFVTYRDTPVVNQDVAFSLHNVNGSIVALREAITNGTGLAYAEYRLPAPDISSGNTTFGSWTIIASVNITQITFSSTVSFVFGYSSNVENVQVPASVHRSESLPVEVTLLNFDKSTTWSELDITVFDEADVPIGSYVLANNQQMQNVTVIDTTISIPSWAFIGQATVYFCLLSTNGTALSPETFANFQILS